MTILYILLFAALWYLIGALGIIISQLPDWYKRGWDITFDASKALMCLGGPITLCAAMICAIRWWFEDSQPIVLLKARKPKDQS